MACLCQDKYDTLDMVKIFRFGYSIRMEWYERAKKIMEEKKIKQVDLERILGDPQSTISRYLNGGRGSDRISVACRFAAALEVPSIELIFGQKAALSGNPKHEELIQMAQEVLDSETMYAVALTENIKAFRHAIDLEREKIKANDPDPPVVATGGSG